MADIVCPSRVGVWNVRGVCEEGKRVEVANVLKEERLNLLALREQNLKDNKEYE